jgi:hypothetical protein
MMKQLDVAFSYIARIIDLNVEEKQLFSQCVELIEMS